MSDGRAPDSLLPAPHGLGFDELKDLIERLERLQETADASMAHFRFDEQGFQTRVAPGKNAEKSSKASTATCLAYLKAVGKLTEKRGWSEVSRHALRNQFLEEDWTSADLPEDNPFTSAFLLEAILDLGGNAGMTPNQRERLNEKIKMLNDELAREGGLSIDEYPQTSFLTHKVVRVLDEWGRLHATARREASKWNWSHLYQESMLIASESPDLDYFELAYSVLTASRTTELDRMTPRERRLLRHAIEQFFAGQRDDGGWPRSRPLFLYPNIGYAYCYDYELLVQLLSERQLRQFVLPHLKELRKAVWALDAKQVPLGRDEAFGWSSEHHGGRSEAESWPTASVLHFCFELQDLVFDAVRQDVFEYVDASYEAPRKERPQGEPLTELMDSTIRFKGSEYEFKERLEEHFLDPLLHERDLVRDGQQFDEAKVSAILFGPPGTSKTLLAKMIAAALGWPLLSLDPSHLTRKGLDNVHAETDALFGRLQFCDQVVVLMDEFDELVREREGTGELRSRFLTTAMLPKIAALHERKRMVYIVATNHLEQFDAAISRRGRFDVIAPVMPPMTAEKVNEWVPLAKVQELAADSAERQQIDGLLGDLTHAEAEELSAKLENDTDPVQVKALFNDAIRDAAMYQQVDPDGGKGETWKARLAGQESKIRGLGF